MSYQPCYCGKCEECLEPVQREQDRLKAVRLEGLAQLARMKACLHLNLVKGFVFHYCPDCDTYY